MSHTRHHGDPRGHHRHRVNQAVKHEARAGRRRADQSLLGALRLGVLDFDDAVFWTKNTEVSNRWSHD